MNHDDYDSLWHYTNAMYVLRAGLRSTDAVLTANQFEVINHIVRYKRDVLYIDRTGSGKSETYFIATKILRDRDKTAGPTIVITPLVSLILDQVRRAKAFGLQAYGYYGSNQGMDKLAQANVESELSKNNIDLLFMTAEMLQYISADYMGTTCTPSLLRAAPALMCHPPLLVIDEIHYIAEAGHEFRLSYMEVWSMIANHPWYLSARKLGLTATVSSRVYHSLDAALPTIRHWHSVRGNLYRENICLRVIHPRPSSDTARVNFVCKLYESDPNAYILVFCRTLINVKEFPNKLIAMGVPSYAVSYFHSAHSAENDAEAAWLRDQEAAFRNGTVHVLFTTCALGLGYDKSDIRYVVHMYTPNSVVQYYQEIGRAGRTQVSGRDAVAYLLPTTPWNSTNWVVALNSICRFLEHSNNCMAPVADVLSRQIHKDSDINQAVELGIRKGILEKSPDGQWLRIMKGMHESDKIFAEQMKEDVEVMRRIGQCNTGCLWRCLLDQFKDQRNPNPPITFTCNKCSVCSPGGDISPDPFASDNIFYRRTGPQSGVPIISLNKKDDVLEFSKDRLKDVFRKQCPSIAANPQAKWTICPIPDSTGSNVSTAYTLNSYFKGMEVNTFIRKNPIETRSVKNASSVKGVHSTYQVYLHRKKHQSGHGQCLYVMKSRAL